MATSKGPRRKPRAGAAKRARAGRKRTTRTAKATRRAPSAKRPVAKRAGKAEGAAAVRAHLAALPAWQREVGERLDALVTKEVPDAVRAIKWSAPFWGRPGKGWFLSFGSFQKHVKVNFFRGTSLKPVPPSGESEQMRALDLRSPDEFDDARIRSWIKQAAAIQGWGKVG